MSSKLWYINVNTNFYNIEVPLIFTWIYRINAVAKNYFYLNKITAAIFVVQVIIGSDEFTEPIFNASESYWFFIW